MESIAHKGMHKHDEFCKEFLKVFKTVGTPEAVLGCKPGNENMRGNC